MTNLKPCPFCGCDAELCYGPGLGTDSCRGYTLYASCSECSAKSPGLWQEKKPEPSDPIWDDVAEEWNCRPGEIDATKCGVAYCEHHPEGLPVCVECREKSTLAHDKACAELAEARAEIERFDRQRRAGWTEIKRLNELLLKTNRVHIENQRLQKDLNGERETNQALTTEIEHLKKRASTLICKEIYGRDELIKQMRNALKWALNEARSTYGESLIKAALAAGECANEQDAEN